MLAPADRIEVEGVPVFDYRVYPVANSIADKLCGIIETHDGRPSSRVKNLVDLLIYATNEDLDGDELCHWCRLEARVRGDRATAAVLRAGGMAEALLEELREARERHGAGCGTLEPGCRRAARCKDARSRAQR